MADRVCPQACVSRAVTAYMSAAQRIGWVVTVRHISPVVTTEGGRGSQPLAAAGMTASLQTHLRVADLPSHFTMHSFRVEGSLTRSLAGTAVGEIMKIGGCKTEALAKYDIVAASTVVAGSRATRENAASATRTLVGFLCTPSSENKSQHVRDRIEASLKKFGWDNHVSDQWVFKRKHNRILSNDATKYGRDHGSMQEAS